MQRHIVRHLVQRQVLPTLKIKVLLCKPCCHYVTSYLRFQCQHGQGLELRVLFAALVAIIPVSI